MIGQNLRLLRLSKELTQMKLAKILGIKRNDLVNWELGRSKPSIENVKLFCEYFATSMEDLYNKDLSQQTSIDEKPPPKPITEKKEEMNIDYKDKYIALLEKQLLEKENAQDAIA